MPLAQLEPNYQDVNLAKEKIKAIKAVFRDHEQAFEELLAECDKAGLESPDFLDGICGWFRGH